MAALIILARTEIMNKTTFLTALFFGTFGSRMAAQGDSVWRSWNQPITPFHVIGNVYYVGASDVTAFLIATSGGLILLDGGFVETAPQILRNIRTLGFDSRDVQIILNSHAHFDHAGGLAALKAATRAQLYAGRGDSALLARGGTGDFFFGDRLPYPPVTVDHATQDGDHVILGTDTLVAIATPGHTRGCTTWAMTVHDHGTAYATLFFCSFSIPGYRVRDHPPYPGITEDYQRSIRRLQALRCDVFLAPHGSHFALLAKAARARAALKSQFIDPDGCRAYLEGAAEAPAAAMNR